MSDKWHEYDIFWEIFAPALFTVDKMSEAPRDVERLLRLTGIVAPARMLDLGCGMGRHALEFARRGFSVTGVDRTRTYLAAARQTAENEGLNIEWVEQDMRLFVRPESYDLVVNLYTSFGYFEDPSDDERVAANILRSLSPGGVLVMDLMGKEILARIFTERVWRELPSGEIFLQQQRIDEGWTKMHNRWILVRDGKIHEQIIEHRIYGASDLKELLRRVGFSRVDVFGSLDGGEYNHAAERLIVVAAR